MTAWVPLKRVLLAAVAAVAVSWPVVGFTATAEEGARFALRPALTIGLVVLGLGVAYLILHELGKRFARSDAGRAVVALRQRPKVEMGATLALLVFLALLPLFAASRKVDIAASNWLALVPVAQEIAPPSTKS